MVIVKNKENIGMLFVFRLVFWFFFKTFLFFMLVIEGFMLIFGFFVKFGGTSSIVNKESWLSVVCFLPYCTSAFLPL